MKEQKNIYMALFLQFLWTVSFAWMNMSWKYVFRTNPNLNGFDYVFIRSISNVFLCVLQASYYKVNIFDIKRNFRYKVYAYGIIGAIGIPTYYIGLKYTPTSIATLIYNISPIIVAVIAPFILNEVLTKVKIFSVFGSFIGASLFILHKNILPGDADHYYLGILMIFFTCLTAVVLIILARILKEGIHYCICPIYFGVKKTKILKLKLNNL